MSGDFLTNQFLIAMPAMTDSNFAQTVTFIWEHNADGALGIIINRPLPMRRVPKSKARISCGADDAGVPAIRRVRRVG